MKTKIVAANWKMNLTFLQAEELLTNLLNNIENLNNNQVVIFAVPFPYLIMAKNKIQNKKNVFIAAQNLYSKKSGAYTGEISAEILASIGVDYVLIGHSERREYFNESNQELTLKINLALENNLKIIFCCGESLQIRESNKQIEFVNKQIEESLFHLNPEIIKNIVIAYEPIWAIGTGKTASTQQAQDMHLEIRKILSKKYGNIANEVSILYGGSVKANNAKELFNCNDVDGGLVGGASLIEAEFLQIIKAI